MVREGCPVCKRNGSSDTCHVCGGGNIVYKEPVSNTAIWKYWMADMVDGKVVIGGEHGQSDIGQVDRGGTK